MEFISTLIISIFFYCLTGQAQNNSQGALIDTELAKKITISSFCLCQTSLTDLQKLSDDFKEIEVEEMDLPKNCYGQDARFEMEKAITP